MNKKSEEQDFIEMVEVGLKEIEEGRTIPLEEIRKMMESWRTKSDQNFDKQPL